MKTNKPIPPLKQRLKKEGLILALTFVGFIIFGVILSVTGISEYEEPTSEELLVREEHKEPTPEELLARDKYFFYDREHVNWMPMKGRFSTTDRECIAVVNLNHRWSGFGPKGWDTKPSREVLTFGKRKEYSDGEVLYSYTLWRYDDNWNLAAGCDSTLYLPFTKEDQSAYWLEWMTNHKKLPAKTIKFKDYHLKKEITLSTDDIMYIQSFDNDPLSILGKYFAEYKYLIIFTEERDNVFMNPDLPDCPYIIEVGGYNQALDWLEENLFN